MKKYLLIAVLTVVQTVLLSLSTKAQKANINNELYKEIYRMDSLMFEAFNQHDVDKMMSFFSDDLEFFHDKGGLDNYEKTRQKSTMLFKNNSTTGLRRTLVPGSLEVYPVPGYGAVEVSSHTFCHKENGKDDCGTFKNIMVWKKINDQWKVSRVISYDH